MAGDPDLRKLTDAVKSLDRSLQDVNRAATALNVNLVALVRILKEENDRAGLSGS